MHMKSLATKSDCTKEGVSSKSDDRQTKKKEKTNHEKLEPSHVTVLTITR